MELKILTSIAEVDAGQWNLVAGTAPTRKPSRLRPRDRPRKTLRLGGWVIAGFGAVISEVGAVMMVGGNLLGRTRVLTTATVLETRKGNFDLAMALGVILLFISFLVNLAMLYLQGRTFER